MGSYLSLLLTGADDLSLLLHHQPIGGVSGDSDCPCGLGGTADSVPKDLPVGKTG